MPPRRPGKGTGDTQPRDGEVYVEFRKVGNAMRVTAVDAASGEEVVIMGPTNVSQDELQRIAVRKLRNRLADRG